MMRITRRTITGMVASALALAGLTEEAEAIFRRGGGAPASGGSPTTVFTFSMTNWNTSSTPGYFRIGMNFPKGAVKSTQNLAINQAGTAIACQFDERTTWSDGSLKICVAHCRDDQNTGIYNASETRAYTVTAQNGSYNNSSSTTISAITGAHDFAVNFSSVLYNPSTGAWIANHPYALNTYMTDSNGSLQQVTTAGTSQTGSHPAWNTTINGTTTDGTVTWTLISTNPWNFTYGSGSFTADATTILNATVSSQSTRLTKVHSGPVCDTWWAWGMAVDNGSSTPDNHLKTYWEISVWKTSGGAVFDIEYAAIVAQDWWGSASPYNAGRYNLNYTATLTKDAGTVQTYSAVFHPYKSWWITCYTGADTNAGRRFWASGTIPTLQYKPTMSYWVANGLIPPLNVSGPTISFGSNPYTATYTPCAPVNVNADIAQTGGSNGRGPIMDSDAWYFLAMRPSDLKAMRLSALSGLGVPYHLRSNDLRTRPGSNAATTVYGGDGGVSDIASCPMALALRTTISGSFASYNSFGMPTPVDAYWGPQSTVQYGYVPPLGGLQWSATASNTWVLDDISSAHGASYSYGIYLLEGEHHFLEVMQDLAMNTIQQSDGNAFGGRPNYIYYNVTNYKNAFSIPNIQWTGVGPMLAPSNTRGTGWGLCIFSEAAAITPDAHYCKQYLMDNAAHNTGYIAASMGTAGSPQLFAYLPNSQVNGGWYTDGGGSTGVASLWMQQFIVMGLYTQATILEDANAQMVADKWLANQVNNVWSGSIYRTSYEKSVVTPSAQPWTSGTAEYFTTNYQAFDWAFSISSATDVLTGISLGNTAFFAPTGFSPQNGDPMMVSQETFTFTNATVPTELTKGTVYYAINVTGTDVGMTMQLTTVQGDSGHIVNFTSDYATVYFSGITALMSSYTFEGQTGSWITGPDSYSGIARAAAVIANKRGNTVTSGTVSTAQTFMSLVDSKAQSNTGPSQAWTWYWA